jgi:beta-phosphoglucomutase-like phosphatase (HAD superfamily)
MNQPQDSTSLRSATPQIKAVVFDMDGLMLNTEDVFDLAGQELLQRRGMDMTDAIRHRRGRHVRQTESRNLPHGR